MPVEDIQLNRFHRIQVALDDRDGLKMPSDIDHQSAPRKPRLVVNGHDRNAEALRRGPDQLKEGLQSVQNAERIGRTKYNMVDRYLQMIGFVLAELLHRVAGTSSFDNKDRRIKLRFAPQWNACFMRKRHQESLLRPLQSRFCVALQCHSKISVNVKLTLVLNYMRWQGHDWKHGLRLSCEMHRKTKYAGES